MKTKYLRLDLLFSYWIFFWYLLYITGIFTYFSPMFAIIMGMIENVFTVILYLYRGISRYNLVKFTVINIFLKIIPLYTLRNESIHLKDIYFTFGLFLIYTIYVLMNSDNVIRYLKNEFYGNINKRGSMEDAIYDNVYTHLIGGYLGNNNYKTIVSDIYDKILSKINNLTK